MSTSTIQAVKGMHDLFESDLATWRHLESVARETFLAYGFGEIRTPIVEETELFVRGVGEGTDIVGKEMFVFQDRDPKAPKSLCLRPENTAGVVRALVERGTLTMADAPPEKVFYIGPQYRNERPQKGRYRQFSQLGCELFGVAQPAADVEVIALITTLLERLGVKGIALHINTLGDAADRPRYRDALVAHFTPHASELSEDSRARLQTNPLRILDSKDDRDRKLAERAPKPAQFLNDDARAHFDAVKAGLERLGITYVVDETLVRGLDYYTRTVFEFIGSGEAIGLGAQSTVAAGGRYDNLVAELGGRATPAVGFASGIERLILVMQTLGQQRPVAVPDVMLIGADDAGRARVDSLAFALRREGFRVGVDLQGKGVGALMKRANKIGARFTLTVGSSEIESGKVGLKRMSTQTVTETTLDAAAIRAELMKPDSGSP